MSEPAQKLRIDKWLWHARFFKTRSKATAAVTGGHVRINGERAAPGGRVQVGDRIELVRDRLPYVFDVVAIPARRGPASEAQEPEMRMSPVVGFNWKGSPRAKLPSKRPL